MSGNTETGIALATEALSVQLGERLPWRTCFTLRFPSPAVPEGQPTEPIPAP